MWDEETGLYYLRSRYYRPSWGRFVSADALIRGNLYAYCRCNPSSFDDENGFEAKYSYDDWKTFDFLTPMYLKRRMYFSDGINTYVAVEGTYVGVSSIENGIYMGSLHVQCYDASGAFVGWTNHVIGFSANDLSNTLEGAIFEKENYTSESPGAFKIVVILMNFYYEKEDFEELKAKNPNMFNALVGRFQADQGLTVDLIVGKNTQKALVDLLKKFPPYNGCKPSNDMIDIYNLE